MPSRSILPFLTPESPLPVIVLYPCFKALNLLATLSAERLPNYTLVHMMSFYMPFYSPDPNTNKGIEHVIFIFISKNMLNIARIRKFYIIGGTYVLK